MKRLVYNNDVMSLEKKCTLLFISLYFLAYPTGMYFPTYITLFGYDGTFLAKLLVLDGVVSVICKLLLGKLIDKGYSRRIVFILSSLVVIGTTLFFYGDKDIFHAVIFTILFRTAGFLLSEVIDGFMIKISHQYPNVDFAKARSGGSIGFGIISLCYGFLLEKFSLAIAPIVIYILMAIFLITYLSIGDIKFVEENSSKGNIRSILNKKFILFALCYCFAYGLLSLTDNYSSIIILDKGGNTFDIGLFDFVRTLIEFFVMIRFSKIADKLGTFSVLAIGSIGFFLKAISISLASSISLAIATAIFQAVSFPFLEPGKIRYLSQSQSQENLALSLSLVNVFSNIFVFMIVDPVMGTLKESYSTSSSLMMLSGIGIIACIGFKLLEKEK